MVAEEEMVEPTTTPWGLIPAAGVALGAFLLFGVQILWAGYVALAVALAVAYFVDKELLRDLFLIAAGLCVVSLTSVKADISWVRFFQIGSALAGAVAVPFLIDRFVYKRRAIRFPWRGGGRWTRAHFGWLALVPFLAWLILPFYFIRSGAYLNWPIIREPSEFARFFVGVNAVGIWDELFFICTCFVLLRRHFPLWQANLLQAIIFVSFLWELGYQVWGPFITFPFALVQGFIFTKTRSLTYVVIVHLIFDAVVFMAIVHARNPELFPIFVY